MCVSRLLWIARQGLGKVAPGNGRSPQLPASVRSPLALGWKEPPPSVLINLKSRQKRSAYRRWQPCIYPICQIYIYQSCFSDDVAFLLHFCFLRLLPSSPRQLVRAFLQLTSQRPVIVLLNLTIKSKTARIFGMEVRGRVAVFPVMKDGSVRQTWNVEPIGRTVIWWSRKPWMAVRSLQSATVTARDIFQVRLFLGNRKVTLTVSSASLAWAHFYRQKITQPCTLYLTTSSAAISRCYNAYSFCVVFFLRP